MSSTKGIYIKQNEVQQFTDCQFFIPKILDWLIDIPKHHVWLTYDALLFGGKKGVIKAI